MFDDPAHPGTGTAGARLPVVPVAHVLNGRPAVAALQRELERDLRSELLQLHQPPYPVAPPCEAAVAATGRGVRRRSIYGGGALDVAGLLGHARQRLATGSQARMLPRVPTSFTVVDRSVALVPLERSPEGHAMAAMVVRAPALLVALVTLFTVLWEQALPLPGGDPAARCTGLDSTDQRIVTLLTAGLKDDAIARQLGMSPRTVRRRVRRLMHELGAQTRFQAGLQAARRGWV